MKLYCIGPVSPRFVAIASSTNANPIVITTSTPHGLASLDVVTVNGHLVNTNANGTFSSAGTPITVLSPTSLSIPVAGNGVGGATGTVSAPQQVINAPNFPSIPGVTDRSKLMVARMLYTPVPFGTATLFIGAAGLNQATFQNVMRPINPPPTLGIYDFYDLEHDGTNIFPIADYWIDAAKPGTESVLCSFWIR